MTASLQFLLPTGQIATAGGIPSAVAASHEPLLVMNDLMARPQPSQVAFFEPHKKDLAGIHASWIGSMGLLGHKINYRYGADTISCISSILNEPRPDIVALSLSQFSLPIAPRHMPLIRGLFPSAMIIAGGLGVVPELAKFVDVVVVGDGDIIAPILFNLRPGTPPDELKKLYARRVIIGPDGNPFEIKAPFGKRIVVRAGDGFEFGEERPLKDRYEEDRNIWSNRYGSPFPLGIRAYLKASIPVPISGSEIDTLFLGSLEFVSSAVKRDELTLYANRGCFGKCDFCSIRRETFGGRGPSVGRILSVIKKTVEEGIPLIRFGDELFIQNRRWVKELLDGIEAGEYHKKTEFTIQTRADTLDEELLSRLMALNFKIAVGVETLLPERAEYANKVPKGMGKRYVAHAKNMIRLMMRSQVGGKYEHTANFILAFKGEGPQAVMKELRAQLEFLNELWQEFGRFPFFGYNPVQIPELGDSFTVLEDISSGRISRINWPEEMQTLAKLLTFGASNEPWTSLSEVFNALPWPNEALGFEYRNDWRVAKGFIKKFYDHKALDAIRAMF